MKHSLLFIYFSLIALDMIRPSSAFIYFFNRSKALYLVSCLGLVFIDYTHFSGEFPSRLFYDPFSLTEIKIIKLLVM